MLRLEWVIPLYIVNIIEDRLSHATPMRSFGHGTFQDIVTGPYQNPTGVQIASFERATVFLSKYV